MCMWNQQVTTGAVFAAVLSQYLYHTTSQLKYYIIYTLTVSKEYHNLRIFLLTYKL